MDSKKKLIISVGAVVIIALAAVIAVVAVLAAQNVSVNSGITINYNPNGVVGAQVKAKYKVGNDGEEVWIGTEDGLNLDGSEETGSSEELGDADISGLSAGQAFVTFTFNFYNSGANAFTATLAYTDVIDEANELKLDANMKITYPTAEDDITVKVEDIDVATHRIELGSVIVPAGESVDYVIVVAVSSEANVAHFSGDFNWTLTAETNS